MHYKTLKLNPTSVKGKYRQGTSFQEGDLKKNNFLRLKVSLDGKLATFRGTQKISTRKNSQKNHQIVWGCCYSDFKVNNVKMVFHRPQK